MPEQMHNRFAGMQPSHQQTEPASGGTYPNSTNQELHQHYSMVSPMPGNTPPIIVGADSSQNDHDVI